VGNGIEGIDENARKDPRQYQRLLIDEGRDKAVESGDG
jgi:hypothetical protein